MGGSPAVVERPRRGSSDRRCHRSSWKCGL